MKKIFTIVFWLPILSSCSLIPESEEKIQIEENFVVEHNYSELEEYLINWEDIFSINLSHYFVYFYSTTCSHCENMKNDIIEIIISRNDIFVVKGSNKVVLKNDVFFTIGAGNVGDFAILGYPALAEIRDGKVSKNVAGKSNILSLL